MPNGTIGKAKNGRKFTYSSWLKMFATFSSLSTEEQLFYCTLIVLMQINRHLINFLFFYSLTGLSCQFLLTGSLCSIDDTKKDKAIKVLFTNTFQRLRIIVNKPEFIVKNLKPSIVHHLFTNSQFDCNTLQNPTRNWSLNKRTVKPNFL